MRKRFLITIPGFLIFMSFLKNDENFEITNAKDLKWSVDIGKTSYRTNVSLTPSYLIIGSNGDNYMDPYLTDDRNGIHIINRVTGKQVRNFAHGSFGDLDVNGTLIHNNLLYFGNDNDEFICADLNGKIKYSLPISGDVECESVVINVDGKEIIVFGTEVGELRAINPAGGETIWQHFHDSFEGWKMGDNRLVFKIKTHFDSGYLFNEKPILEDLNADGIKDLVFVNIDEFYSVDGKTGNILYRFDTDDKTKDWRDPSKLNIACGAESIIFKTNESGEKTIVFPAYSYNIIPNSNRTDGYKFHMVHFNLKGKMIQSELIDADIQLHRFKRIPDTKIFCNGEKIFQFDDQIKLKAKNDLEKKTKKEDYYYSHFISNQLISYQNQPCISILHEDSNVFTCYNVKTGKIMKTIDFQERSEFTPVFLDVNKDGKLDLLIADDSNKLSCIELESGFKILNK